MLIKEKIGNLSSFKDEGRPIERLSLEWFETSKRIMHKRTGAGKEVVLKFLDKSPNLRQDDILFADEHSLIVVEILSCDAIVIIPRSTYEMAYVCYEIGNKHLPLFFEENLLMIPFDEPAYKQLLALGLAVTRQKRKLLNQLRTSVLPHSHPGEGKSLFSRIMKITNPPANE
jgi:urease accessory protein